MTSANITGFMDAQNLVTKVSKLSEEIATGVDFSEMLSSNPSPNGSYEFKASMVSENKMAPSSSTVSYEKEQSAAIAGKEKVTEKPTEISDDKKAELKDAAKDLDKEVKDAIEEELDVTEDEVVEVLEQLGLVTADLLNPANLAKVVTELTGSEDVTAVLLDESFADLKTEITNIFTDFANQNDMQIDEFSQVMTELLDTEVMPEEEITVLPNLDEAGPSKGASDAIASNDVDDIKSTQITQHVTKTDENGEVEVTDTSADGKETVTVVSNAKASSNEKSDDSSEEEKEDAKESKVTVHHEHTVINANVEDVNQTFTDYSSNEVLPQVNPREIIEQIVEQTKVSLSNNENSVEMILNPEELGKLLLKVVSDKNGQVAAHITVQNEDVKEALTAQMAVLKDTLNEQGVKIDAIEVTVSAHEFEENLDNQFSNEQQQGEQAEQKANARRNINLNDLDSLSGLMSEEEMLVAQMMADEGNTVNLTA
ncbi:MAG: flagellar hook-length control protein FliK [Lachnospiraceae bacterium]|nr:flagellar hook-length control protein FliK [Lachnospiraceae bacterium]